MKEKLAEVASWREFETLASKSTAKERGDLFELLTKYYLLLNPTYRTELSDVWLLSEVPQKIRKDLNLPDKDQGIDIIAHTKTGVFWAIQCKYRGSAAHSLTWREISTFAGLTFGVCKNIEFGLIAYTGERYSKVLDMAEHVGFLSSDVWSALDEEFFKSLSKTLNGQKEKLVIYQPRPHQKRAIKKAREYFEDPKNTRGKLIMPCGSGKSLTGFWIAEALDAQTVVVAVPSLALIQQTLPVWLREFAARNENIHWLCVCSDQTVAKDTDSIITRTQDLGYPCMTNAKDIAVWLKETKSTPRRVIFTTYQSGKVLAEAVRAVKAKIDLGIMDEAHKTVGQKDKLFSHLLFDENLPIKRRIFMTATERRYAGKGDEVISMDDPKVYGETFELLSFKEALEQDPPILSDYKIITMVVSQEEVEKLISENRYVKPSGGMWEREVEAQMLASLVALRKAMQKYPIKHAVSFHSSIARAHAFKEFNDTFTEFHTKGEELDTFHVTGAMPSAVRKQMLIDFSRTERGVITNARCLTEGVDVPNIDCVLFADPKQSTIDIVQAVGRALRPSKGKKYGYILVPVVANGDNADEFTNSDAFAAVMTVLRALAANDERIIEHFRAIHNGRRMKGRTVEVEIDERIARSLDLEKFAEYIEAKVWDRLGRLSWRDYEEAREFVHKLKLRGQKDWENYTRRKLIDLPQKPADIPSAPAYVYREFFHLKGGWGAWLGTGSVATRNRRYKLYKDAQKFVRNLGLKNAAEWKAYCLGKVSNLPAKPDDIPAYPESHYGKEFYEKGGMGNWLGTGYKKNISYLPYSDASSFVHKLDLKTGEEWRAYCQRKRKDLPEKPHNIPANPLQFYGNEFTDNGGMGGWLGTGNVAMRFRKYRSYEEAASFVRKLNLTSQKEWWKYSKGELKHLPIKPLDIPSDPHVYKDEFKKGGGFDGWLGTKSRYLGEFRKYDEAVKFVHSLKLANSAEWLDYCRGFRPDLPGKPADIPKDPYSAYRKIFTERGGMFAWLGAGRRRGSWRSYEDARGFIVSLKLKGITDWKKYINGELLNLPPMPDDIPRSPASVYKKDFLKNGGWGHWLGTEFVAMQKRSYLTYRRARQFARSLKLKNKEEWIAYSKGLNKRLGLKPANIPADPQYKYGTEFKNNGGWRAWLSGE